MGDVKIGHIIQVKEERFSFFSDKCCKSRFYEPIENESGVFFLGKHGDGEYPDRCSHHNTNLMRWRRIDKFKKKWTRLFTKNYIRWRFVKMLTITLPPYMHIDNIQDYLKEDTITYLRNEILTRFRKLCRNKYWKDHVDGGQWFFECPIINGKANPHFHIILVGPKLINQEQLQKHLVHYHLGSIAKFSSPKNSEGVIQKMTYWRNRKLVMNKSAVKRAINYAIKYVSKDSQIDGKNNSYFGKLFNVRK